jgi:hypothetical protein
MSVYRNLKIRHIFALSTYFNKSYGQIVDYLVLHRSKKIPLYQMYNTTLLKILPASGKLGFVT